MRFLDNNFVTRCYYLSQGTFLIQNKFNIKVVLKVEKSWQRQSVLSILKRLSGPATVVVFSSPFSLNPTILSFLSDFK